jgi:hypothetical protein
MPGFSSVIQGHTVTELPRKPENCFAARYRVCCIDINHLDVSNKRDSPSGILHPSHTSRSHSSLSVDVMTANGSNHGFVQVLIPEPLERRLSHVSCGPDAEHGRAPAIPSDAIVPSVQETQSAQKTTLERPAPKNAGTISQVCDYCRRNNKACRLKQSGTCFNCAERKKKCRFSGKPMSTGKDHVTGPNDAAVTQLNVPQPPVTPPFVGTQHRPRSNPDNFSDHVTGLHESAPLLSHSRVGPPAPSSPTGPRDSLTSVGKSTVEDDVELPPNRTIRSSNLVRRWAGEVTKMKASSGYGLPIACSRSGPAVVLFAAKGNRIVEEGMARSNFYHGSIVIDEVYKVIRVIRPITYCGTDFQRMT